jgi:hypothetical protein
LIDSAVKRFGICFGRLRKPANLSDELKRGRSDFVIGSGGLEIKKCSDISAHGREILPPPRERALERASMPEQSALLTDAKVLNTDATVRSKTTATTSSPIRAANRFGRAKR